MYEIILIDIDNTLLDFSLAEEKAIRNTFKQYNISCNKYNIEKFKEINENLWKQFELKKISKQELLQKRFTDFFSLIEVNIPLNSAEINDYYLNELSSSSDLMPNAYEALSELSKSVKIYAVTNGVYNTQMKRLNSSTIKQFFSDIFISEVIGIQKPEIGFFEFVFSKLNNPKKDKVLMVGDSLSADIIGGINFGLDTCWYNPRNLVGNIKPTYIISDLLELLKISI